MKGVMLKKVLCRISSSLAISALLVSSFSAYASANEEIEVGEQIEIADEVCEDIDSVVEVVENEDYDDCEVSEIEVNSNDEAEPLVDDNVIIDESVVYEDELEVVGASGDFSYVSIGSNQCKVTSYNGTSSYVSIPPTIDNLTVSVIGEDFLYNKTASSSVTQVNIPKTVTEIQKNAFRGCTNLQSITIEKNESKDSFFLAEEYSYTLKSIGEYAFYGDTKLSSLDLSTYGVTTIGAYAFAECTGIKYISLHNSVKNIGDNAFLNVTSLERFDYYGSLSDWESVNFMSSAKGTHPNAYAKQVRLGEKYDEGWGRYVYELFIPNSLNLTASTREIRAYLYAGFSGLKSVDLSEVNTIREGAFSNCTSLETVTLSERLSTLEANAFCGDIALKTISIDRGLSVIGSKAFAGCASLNNITIHSNVSTIIADAFDDCDSLNVVNVYSGTAADTYFKAKPGCWVKYLDENAQGTQIDNRLVGYSALYNGKIGMKFYFSMSGIVRDRDYVTFVWPSGNGNTSEDIKFTNAAIENINGVDCYVYTIYFAPKDFCTQIGAKVVINGVGNSNTYWISFADYVNTVLSYSSTYIGKGDNSSTLINLIESLVTYCDASAKYFGTDSSKINSNYLLNNESAISYHSEFGMSISNSTYLGSSIVLEDTMTVKLYFSGKQNIGVKAVVSDFSSYLKADVSKYVSVEYIDDKITVVSISGYQFGSDRFNSDSIPLSYMLNLTYNGVTSNDRFCGYSYMYLAVNEGYEKLEYIAGAMYSLDSAISQHVSNHYGDILVNKK